MQQKNAFLRMQDAVKFIEALFGRQQPFEIRCGDEIIRNEGRRADDLVVTRTFLEQRTTDICFTITFQDSEAADRIKCLPDIFKNPDYPKVLRNRYRELNRTEIKHWKIDCRFSRLGEGEGSRHQVSFDFTVSYGGEHS